MYRGTLPVQILKGDKVEIEFEQNGEYKNIKNVKVISQAPKVQSAASSGGYNAQHPSIALINCVTACVCKYIEFQTELRKTNKQDEELAIPEFMALISENVLNNYLFMKERIDNPMPLEMPITAPIQ
jgi:hypothetical protein